MIGLILRSGNSLPCDVRQGIFIIHAIPCQSTVAFGIFHLTKNFIISSVFLGDVYNILYRRFLYPGQRGQWIFTIILIISMLLNVFSMTVLYNLPVHRHRASHFLKTSQLNIANIMIPVQVKQNPFLRLARHPNPAGNNIDFFFII